MPVIFKTLAYIPMENLDPNHPERSTKPAFNSTTDHRPTEQVPGVENLNQDSADREVPENDESLFGTPHKTDLGNGDRDPDEKDNEKLIEP